jgi:hypothetical protein
MQGPSGRCRTSYPTKTKSPAGVQSTRRVPSGVAHSAHGLCGSNHHATAQQPTQMEVARSQVPQRVFGSSDGINQFEGAEGFGCALSSPEDEEPSTQRQ